MSHADAACWVGLSSDGTVATELPMLPSPIKPIRPPLPSCLPIANVDSIVRGNTGPKYD
jgi:hypothetical protein